jgi:hypothetical protein
VFDFIVIGAMKSGTTTIHDILAKDCRIALPLSKEAPFFTNPEKILMGEKRFLSTYYGATKGKILGKVSPQYMAWPDVARTNMAKISPNTKIIAVIRDPVDRLISHYSMYVGQGEELRDISTAIRSCLEAGDSVWAKANFTNTYIAWSCYGRILNDYFNQFPSANMLVLNFNELATNQPSFMRKVYAHIGIESPDYKNFKNINSLKRGDSSKQAKHFVRLLPIVNKLAGALPERYKSIVRMRIIQFKTKVLSPKVSQQEIDPILVDQLKDIFEQDAKLLTKHGIHPYWINSLGKYEHSA